MFRTTRFTMVNNQYQKLLKAAVPGISRNARSGSISDTGEFMPAKKCTHPKLTRERIFDIADNLPTKSRVEQIRYLKEVLQKFAEH